MKHIIRTSDRIAFKRCRRSWDFSSFNRQGLRPLKPARPLEFGTAWHAAMEVYYDPDTWHIAREPITQLAKARFLTLNQEQMARARELGDVDYDVEQEYEERVELGLGMLDGYAGWASQRDAFTPVKVEYDFEVPIKDPGGYPFNCDCHGWPVVYRGRIDGIVKDDRGFFWILEHKTAAQLNDTVHLNLDEQCGSYAWALHEIGISVKGVIYNEAVKRAPKPLRRLKNGKLSSAKNQSTTYEMAKAQLEAEGYDTSVGPHAELLDYLDSKGTRYFRRTQVHRNAFELSELGRRIYYEARDMVDPELAVYPNPNRFTCQWCAFKEPCVMMNDGSDYQFVLDHLFEKGEPRDEPEVETEAAEG